MVLASEVSAINYAGCFSATTIHVGNSNSITCNQFVVTLDKVSTVSFGNHSAVISVSYQNVNLLNKQAFLVDDFNSNPTKVNVSYNKTTSLSVWLEAGTGDGSPPNTTAVMALIPSPPTFVLTVQGNSTRGSEWVSWGNNNQGGPCYSAVCNYNVTYGYPPISVTITHNTQPGYTFTGWQCIGQACSSSGYSGTNNNIVLNMNSSITEVVLYSSPSTSSTSSSSTTSSSTTTVQTIPSSSTTSTAQSTSIQTTFCTSRKWFPAPSVPSSLRPLFFALLLTLEKSAPVYIHRKGATRAFAKGREEYSIWQEAVNGSVWHGSKYGLAYSLAKRGAKVKIMSNTKDEGYDKKLAVYENVNLDTLTASYNETKQKVIEIRIRTRKLVSEEAEWTYKDIDQVIDVVEKCRLSKAVSRNVPLAVIKG